MIRMVMSLVLFGLSTAVCLGETSYATGERQTSLILFAHHPFVPPMPYKNEIGDYNPLVPQRFGTPRKKEERHNVPDYRDPTTNLTIYTFQYEGLVITTFGPESKGRKPKNTWIDTIVLSSPKYQLVGGLQIGAPKKAFLDYLDAPGGEQYKSKLVYYAEDFEYRGDVNFHIWVRVTIEFDNHQRANKIVWAHLAD